MRKNSRIPNFRNLGIHLRVLLLHVAMLALLTLFRWQTGEWWLETSTLSLQLLPPLLLTLGALYAGYPQLQGLSYRQGVGWVLGLALLTTSLLTLCYHHWISPLSGIQWSQVLLLCLADTAACLYYLNLLQRAYSPAIAEARLQALQARIRPHFLFNSLNAVLSLIRSQPQRAEAALEDMAELFRVLMADNRELVPLTSEIQLCHQYLNIEKLRLDTRLHCEWQLQDMPADCLIPPLILQPLLENAVYHGIEPLPEGGRIVVQIQARAGSTYLRISNPLPRQAEHSSGNRMALKNIQERLRLHYDLEATLKQSLDQAQYVVELLIPNQPLPANTHD